MPAFDRRGQVQRITTPTDILNLAEEAMDSEDPLALDGKHGALNTTYNSVGFSSRLQSEVLPTAEVENGRDQGDDGGRVEVETLNQDEFDFLDGAAELGSLRSELEDVRRNLAQRRSSRIPLKLYRQSCNNSIRVSDVQSGLWCEVQVEYRYLHQHMKNTRGWSKLEQKGRPVQLRTPEMRQGTDIHLAKELEVHERVKVVTKTAEDKCAVTLIDTYTQLATVAAGGLEREIAVFGDLFDQGILVNGIIDQVQFCKDVGELTILDYKTRRTNTLPHDAQKQGHALQLMLYKCMLDNLTCGVTQMSQLAQHKNLNFSRELSEGVLKHITRCGLQKLFMTQSDVTEDTRTISDLPGLTESGICVTFGALAGVISTLIVGLNLPLVSRLTVQYVYQQTHEEIGVEVIEHDETWARKMLESSLNFWLGRREAQGVDLEDLWKCDSCQFRDVCVWKKQKDLEQSPAAFKPHHIF